MITSSQSEYISICFGSSQYTFAYWVHKISEELEFTMYFYEARSQLRASKASKSEYCVAAASTTPTWTYSFMDYIIKAELQDSLQSVS